MNLVGNVESEPLTGPRRSLNCRGFQSQGFFNPAVRFQLSERAPEFNSGLFVSEKRDSGVVLSLKFGFGISGRSGFESRTWTAGLIAYRNSDRKSGARVTEENEKIQKIQKIEDRFR